MDPNETLRQVLELIDRFKEADEAGYYMSAMIAARDFMPLIEALDEWLRKGGFLPDRWSRAGAERPPQ